MSPPIDADGTDRLVELSRGDLVESQHRGALAVVAADGKLLASVGDPGMLAYMRSAAKPFQALPTVASGALDHYRLSQQALAILCGSHHGTQEHVRVVQQILDSIGLDVAALRCGVHWPTDKDSQRQLARAGQGPDARHNNCSGKHAGMLALARYWRCREADYTLPDHPVQRAILAALSDLADLPAQAIHIAPDGCTVPTFSLPLRNAALAYARLIDPAASPHCQRVVAAMQSYPHLVANHDALDDLLLRAGQGRIVSKGGAEGYQGLGILTPECHPLGIALKIADGSARAKGTVIYAVLEALGLADETTLDRMASLRRPPRINRRNQVVGEIRPAFCLSREQTTAGPEAGG